jgi:hypothetical protein
VCEQFGIPKAKHGVISVMPDEGRGVAYVSTCSDDRPIDHTHFMVLDLKAKTYRDLGDMEHPYAFIVLDHKGRAYHPVRGGLIARYDPDGGKLEKKPVTIDGQPPPAAITKDGAILNWETSPDRRTLFAVEMTTNQLYSFDLAADGETVPGRSLGPLLPPGSRSDCRAMCVGPDGTVWAAVTDHAPKEGPLLHLVRRRPGEAPKDLGPVGIANPDYTTFTDAAGKAKPWHHTVRKAKDGTLTPWQPMGVCATPDGRVYLTTIAPFTLLRYDGQP